jgi:predicted O-linked N-acetylglucosamine transferase (SPINDLY family)
MLIFPEVSRDRVSAFLAALPLAPVQCAAWGMPRTTGYPTIDYFLSGDLMEHEDAQEHYSEKLIRLPNLSSYYEPTDSYPADVDRAYFRLRDDLPLLLCTQATVKLLPQFDYVFVRIAKELGPSQIIFVGSNDFTEIQGNFMQRLGLAFSQSGMNINDHVKIFKKLEYMHYLALNKLSDVFLDGIGFSGCVTTLDALSQNLPVVTMPLELMRSRQSNGILKMIGVTETIAQDPDAYIDIAVRLCKDRAWRDYISQKIAQNKHKAYRDKECIRGLENFIQDTIRQRATGER